MEMGAQAEGVENILAEPQTVPKETALCNRMVGHSILPGQPASWPMRTFSLSDMNANKLHLPQQPLPVYICRYVCVQDGVSCVEETRGQPWNCSSRAIYLVF